MASAELTLGASQGFRQRREQLRKQGIVDEELARQHKREDTQDATAAEDRSYKLTLRAATQKQAEQEAAASAAAQQAAAQRVEQEGMVDLFDGLMAGTDPALAIGNYNARGTHKIDPNGVAYDPKTKTLTIRGPDGTPTQVNVQQARGELNRLMSDSTKAEGKKALRNVKGDELVIDEDGNEVFRGPQYGKKDPEKPQSLVNTSEGIYDPNRKNPDGTKGGWIPGPAGAAGGAGGRGSDTTPGGSKRSTYNRQAAQTETRDELARAMGMKIENGLAPKGSSELWLDASSTSDAIVAKYEDTIGAGQAAQIVNEAYKDAPPFAKIREEVRKKAERGSVVENGHPRRESHAEFEERVTKEAKAALAADRKMRRDQANETAASLIAAQKAQSGAEPGADAPGAAAAAPAGRAPHAGVPLTPDRITGKDPKAVKLFQSNPTLFKELTSRTPDGKSKGVISPDGTVYYLVGSELRSYKPPTE